MINLDDFKIDEPSRGQIESIAKRPYTKAKRQHRFVRGPIDAEWIENAGRLPGKCLHVALACIYLDGFIQTGSIVLKPSVRNSYGVNRHSGGRALKALEREGLIRVEPRSGAAPIVHIVPIRRPTPEVSTASQQFSLSFESPIENELSVAYEPS